jgi:hypothetical protein
MDFLLYLFLPLITLFFLFKIYKKRKRRKNRSRSKKPEIPTVKNLETGFYIVKIRGEKILQLIKVNKNIGPKAETHTFKEEDLREIINWEINKEFLEQNFQKGLLFEKTKKEIFSCKIIQCDFL